MGYWFENMKKMDIQAERRNTAEAREELKKARQELDEAKKEADEAKEKMVETLKQGIKAVIEVCQEFGLSKEETYTKVSEKMKETYKELNEDEIKAVLEAEID